MKKLITMILMLISLSANASEVILECRKVDDSGEKSTQIYGFDEAKGDVFVLGEDGKKYVQNNAFITKAAFGAGGWQISRMTGEYSYRGKYVQATGKCALFKQAF